MLFSNLVETSLYDQKTLDFDLIDNSDYELIISDYIIPNNLKKNWIYIPENQTYNGFRTIVRSLYKLVMEKNRVTAEAKIFPNKDLSQSKLPLDPNMNS